MREDLHNNHSAVSAASIARRKRAIVAIEEVIQRRWTHFKGDLKHSIICLKTTSAPKAYNLT
jgi:hypothetical protein